MAITVITGMILQFMAIATGSLKCGNSFDPRDQLIAAPDNFEPNDLPQAVQAQRFHDTGILTAVNEDSLDRPPYFLYYNVYAYGQPWNAINVRGQNYPQFRFVSTKAAFSWLALMPNHPYAKKLRDFVQNLAERNGSYLSGRYENHQLGVNATADVNTNAVILESLLYQARGRRPLAF